MNDPRTTTYTSALSVSIARTVINTGCDGSHVHTYVVAICGAVREKREDTVRKGVHWVEGGASEVKAAIHKHQRTLVCSCLL